MSSRSRNVVAVDDAMNNIGILSTQELREFQAQFNENLWDDDGGYDDDPIEDDLTILDENQAFAVIGGFDPIGF